MNKKTEHHSGILMPISSLPSKYGIGNFGKDAYKFADFLAKTKQKYWQVLPLNPTSYGDSPYQSPASASGNPYFIDPEVLYEDGLLTKEDLKEAINKNKRVDYGWLFNTRYDLLRKAFSRFNPNDDYFVFCKNNQEWLDDYALFMSLKVQHGYAEWTSWENDYQDYEKAKELKENFEEEMKYWRFIQYEFHKQWDKLHQYVKNLGIKIIGDMPIYVAHDSMDVWCSPEDFLLDEKHQPTLVAGCPPDGFSPDGQLWGNPIYNWDKMEKDGFTWWKKRIKESFKLYDVLRIDHFRGFAGYYAIPFGHETARFGSWYHAPGIELFDTIKKHFPKAEIIAEDLGFITEDVRELLAKTGFPGMKILQFAFYDDDAEFLPRMFKDENCIVYTGSHDSDCTKTWYQNLNGDAKKRFKKECPKRKNQTGTEALIEFALNSKAFLAIIPIQDYLELTNDLGRMNTPAVASGNWTWRLSSRYATDRLINKISKLTIDSKRI
ncbi:MAG: 4-alpha-glucanotransferase [Bacilli bacterium]|nr:4-alpha-glucanotransferase [Bacilli bacterium]